jgi:S-adenosylmethionine:tRNA ribosyltransferase-isomerase
MGPNRQSRLALPQPNHAFSRFPPIPHCFPFLPPLAHQRQLYSFCNLAVLCTGYSLTYSQQKTRVLLDFWRILASLPNYSLHSLSVRTDLFDYPLPPELIAQKPLENRDSSRLLVWSRPTLAHSHLIFCDLPSLLRPNDLLVLNNSKVIAARLRGTREKGGKFEILLTEENAKNDWWALLKPGRRVRAGSKLRFQDLQENATDTVATVLEKNPAGQFRLLFEGTENILNELGKHGEIPLPPYITRPSGPSLPQDCERYQTVFASPLGSVAAPTAGLHFTPELLANIPHVEVTLHVGLGTFAPVKVDDIEAHKMHSERFEVTEATAERIKQTKAAGGRIVAVGTTSLRVLESVARANHGAIVAGHGSTDIFIFPPFQFRSVDALITNFHLPKSTLFMLVSAFMTPGSTDGISQLKALYEIAIRERYRFFSYGDAMLIS